MKAVVLNGITPADEIRLSDVPIPEVKPGWVLIKVKAFGMNHSEQILRQQEIAENYITKPVIPGIECVGLIEEPSDTRFHKGQKVCAFMGGMGRRFNGSYAEYALLPERQVFAVATTLPWERLGAVPETYFTAWGSLFECLRLEANDVLLVRGGTCALGYAAIQLAKALGCRVIATTHRAEKIPLLEDARADESVLDDGIITGKVHGATKVLELVGPRNLRDTLSAVEKGGIVCNTGILGGIYTLDGFDPIKEIPNGVYLTGFFSNYPSQEIVDEVFRFLDRHNLTPKVGAVYDFTHIREACLAQDGKQTVDGKIVVTLER